MKDVFRNILSIGYEFETHDLAKMSLTEEGALVNSNTTLRNIKRKQEEGMAEKVDEHSYEIMEESGLFFREYFDEPDVASGKDEEGKYNVVMHITNDRASTNFTKMLTEKCYGEESSKDDLYSFQTVDGKTFPIHFSGEMLEAGCGAITGTEYVMTFYHPKKSGNVILDTFLHATKLMIQHLNQLVPVSGGLYFTGEEQPVGTLEERFLYNKPGTNLYYLETHEIDDTDTEMFLDKVGFVPQMTFRVSIEHLLPVLRSILFQNDFSFESTVKKEIMNDYHDLVHVEKLVSALLEGYNAGAGEEPIPLQEEIGQTIFGFLFMIFYKIYMYCRNYSQVKKDEEDGTSEFYFKDFLCFASRHSNDVFYEKIKELLGELFPSASPASVVMKIIDQPEVINKFVRMRPDDGQDHDGDPSFSVVSYFAFFEKEREEEDGDWFVASGLDIFTTLFDLPEDGSILLENRLFYKEVSAYIDSIVRKNTFGSYPSIRNYKRFYEFMMKREKEKKRGDKVWNPLTRRFVKKCKPGYARNTKFQCRFSRRLKKCGPGKELNPKTKRCRKIRKTVKKETSETSL